MKLCRIKSLVWSGIIDRATQLQSSASQGAALDLAWQAWQGDATSAGHHAFTTSATSEGTATSGGGLVFSGGSYFPFGGAAPVNLTAQKACFHQAFKCALAVL